MDAVTLLGPAFLSAWADDEGLFANFLFGRATRVGPDLEHTLAMASIGQDEFGHTDMVLDLLLPDSAEKERYWFERDPSRFRSCALLRSELADDWALFAARAFLYEEAEAVRLEWLAVLPDKDSALERTVQSLAREEREHLPHWHRWMKLLAAADGQPRRRLDSALQALGANVSDTLWAAADCPSTWDARALRAQWASRVAAVLRPLHLDSTDKLLAEMRADPRPGPVPDTFSRLIERMQSVWRSEPAARTWG